MLRKVHLRHWRETAAGGAFPTPTPMIVLPNVPVSVRSIILRRFADGVEQALQMSTELGLTRVHEEQVQLAMPHQQQNLRNAISG